MKNTKLTACIIPCLIYILVVGIIMFYALFFTDLHDGPNEPLISWSDEWSLPDGQLVNVDKLSAKANEERIVLTKTIPDTIAGNVALCFMAHNSDVEVYLDNTLIHAYTSTENIIGYGYSDVRHSVLLSGQDTGKQIRIEYTSSFKKKGEGNVEKIYLGNPDDYERMLLKGRLIATIISLIIIFFGIMMIGIYFFIPQKEHLPYNVMALGFSALLMGCWCLSGTGIIQLITGHVIAFRIVNYFFVFFASFPILSFVNSFTVKKSKTPPKVMFIVWILFLMLILVLRFVMDIDLHNVMILFYAEYAFTFIYMAILLIDNKRYCSANNINQDRRFFVAGSLAFFAGASLDMISYFIIGNFHFSQGTFVRLGLCCFIFLMIIHFLYWWAEEQQLMQRTDFVNNVLQYAVASNDPEKNINDMLAYLVKRLKVDRAFIFEKNPDGSFANTYECCAEHVKSKSADFMNIPLEGYISKVYEDIEQTGQAIIRDINDLKDNKNNDLYNMLHEKGINNSVAGVLEANGENFGMCGVENLRVKTNLDDISEIIRLLSYFFGQLIAQRNNNRMLIRLGYNDQLTGAGNRRAFEKFERTSLDPKGTFGYIMCDINGLKKVNDSHGHEAGDEMIKYVGQCFIQIFGVEHVFRMGGDEFVILSFADSESALIEQINTAQKMITDRNYTASIGYVFCENGNIPLNEIKKKADQLMYHEKELFYQGSNERRRIY